jgi:hypothetical protein
MSQTAGAEATKSVDVVYVVHQLQYRLSDPGRTSATVVGVFRNKTDAVACLNKAYEERLSEYGYHEDEDEKPIDPDCSSDMEFRRLSDGGNGEGDVDEFEIEECEIH